MQVEFRKLKLPRTYYLLLFLIIIGAFLRLYRISDTLVFLGDQGRDASIVYRLLHGDPVLVGPTTSVGKIQLGPFFYYLMAPFLWLWHYNPVGPAIGIALIGIITIPILFFTFKEFFGDKIAWFSTISYVFSDVIIRNTRFSWNPNPMPLVIILMLWSANKVYLQKKYKFLLLLWLCFAIGMQLHYMILLILPFLAVFMIMIWLDEGNDKIISFNWQIFFLNKRRKEILKYLLYSFGILLFFLSPLIVFDFRHNFLNFHGFLDFFETGDHSPHQLAKTLQMSHARFYQMIGLVLGFESWQRIRDYISISLFILTILNIVKYKLNKAWIIYAIYFISALIGLILYNGDVYEHYLGFIYPLSFLILGLGIEYLYKQKNIIIKVLGILFLIFILYKNILNYRNINILGWQTKDIKRLATQISNDAGSYSFNIVLFDDTKDYRAMNYRYFLEVGSAKVLSIDDYQHASVLYIISDDKDLNINNINAWEVRSFSKKSNIIKKWQVDNFLWVYKLTH